VPQTKRENNSYQLITAVNDPLNALTCCKLPRRGVIIADASVSACLPEITVYPLTPMVAKMGTAVNHHVPETGLSRHL